LSNYFKFKGTGRRKSAIAQVELLLKNSHITSELNKAVNPLITTESDLKNQDEYNNQFFINGKSSFEYLQGNPSALIAIQAPLDLLRLQKNYDIFVKVQGGGISGQAEAIKLAIARALCQIKTNYRSSLKKEGFLTRDSRCKERKKYGLKKARKASQFSKR
jgi:small subunit ribosomal protein S9